MKKFVLEDLRSNVNITVQHEVEHNPTEATHNDSERVADLAPYFVKYGFLQIRSHNMLTSYDVNNSLIKNTVFIYASPQPFASAGRKVNIGFVNVPPSDVFFDILNKMEVENPEKFINIYCYPCTSDEMFMGVYDVVANTLYICDITHEAFTIEKALSENIVERIMEAINIKEKKIKIKKPKTKIDVTLGCDPEFIMYDLNGRVVKPYDLGFSSTSSTEKIGADGIGSQLELRPSPSTKPLKVVKEIRELFKTVINNDVVLSTKGDDYPLGGHIHVGNIRNKLDISVLVKLLDYFLGESTINLSGAARGSYKKLSAYETKPWGFEYRTPPAAIFENPTITKICLKIVKNAIEYLYKHKELVLPDKPTVEEYKKYCGLTDKEIVKFFKFISNYKEKVSNISLLAAWGLKIPKGERATHNISFSDNWRTDIENAVRNILLQNCILTKNVVFYGLKKERGDVTTIRHPELNKIYGACPDFSDVDHYIGLPFTFRTATEFTKLHEVVTRIIKNILIERGVLKRKRGGR